jgi:carbon storage regulator
MLVLSRKIGEQILIGDAIRVTVAGICGNKVRLGITAPAEICVLRMELCVPQDQSCGEDPRSAVSPGG